MRLAPALVLLAACGARVDEPRWDDMTGLEGCPTDPATTTCPKSLVECNLLLDTSDFLASGNLTLHCEDGKVTGYASRWAMEHDPMPVLEYCGPGLRCPERSGCVIPSCGRTCTCAPDGHYRCPKDTC